MYYFICRRKDNDDAIYPDDHGSPKVIPTKEGPSENVERSQEEGTGEKSGSNASLHQGQESEDLQIQDFR